MFPPPCSSAVCGPVVVRAASWHLVGADKGLLVALRVDIQYVDDAFKPNLT